MRLSGSRAAQAFVIRMSLIAASAILGAQGMGRMEFRDAPVKEILLALARASGRSIVPDQTVSGTATFAFSQMGLDEALGAFLPTAGLYASESGGPSSCRGYGRPSTAKPCPRTPRPCPPPSSFQPSRERRG
jgi:hypothetical protein